VLRETKASYNSHAIIRLGLVPRMALRRKQSSCAVGHSLFVTSSLTSAKRPVISISYKTVCAHQKCILRFYITIPAFVLSKSPFAALPSPVETKNRLGTEISKLPF
jgi:hypothetical protein